MFIACRSNHDRIKVANLFCPEHIGRDCNPEANPLRYVGVYKEIQNKKCHVLVDGDFAAASSKRQVERSCSMLVGDNGKA
jgi:hypothetical protein